MSTFLLAINCGSSSIKAKLYQIPDRSGKPLDLAASLSVSNINAKGEQLKIKIKWANKQDVEKEQDGDDIERKPNACSADQIFISSLSYSMSSASRATSKRTTSNISPTECKLLTSVLISVHGGTHKHGIQITKEHTEGLTEMDKLSEFAPLHVSQRLRG